MKDVITCNGYPVVMSLELRTEPGEGWVGSRFLGEYTCMKSLSEAINKHREDVPIGWMLVVDFQDEVTDEEDNSH